MRHTPLFETLEDRRLLSVSITSIAANSAVAGTPTDTVVRGEKATLTATGVAATTSDKVTSVVYFLDINSDGIPNRGDRIIGSSNNAAKNYAVKTDVRKNLPLGPLTISAVARGKGKLNISPAVTDIVTVVNDPPKIAHLTASPKRVAPGGKLTLVANGVTDKDGNVAKVDFWLDVDKNGVLDPLVDTLVGSDSSKVGGFKVLATSATAGHVAGDTLNFLAQATDNDGDVSTVGAAQSVIVTIK